MFSASRLASLKWNEASFCILIKLEILFFYDFAIPKPAAIPIIAEITIVNMSMFVKIYK
jgi:hypothetical protein